MAKSIFVSVNFNLAGKVLLVLGFILIIINALDYILQRGMFSNALFLIGIVLVGISLYLINFKRVKKN